MKRAFTLAEILSVLIILGIVAAITIPTTIRYRQRQQTITRLKIAYNMLTKLTERSWIENNYTIPMGRHANDDTDWNTFVRPYLKIVHDCGREARDRSCFAGPNGYWYNPEGKSYDSADWAYGPRSFHKAILSNGMSIAFKSCDTCVNLHNIFFVDIDGPQKGYSRMGQDVFMFEWVNPDKVWLSGGVRRPPAPELVPFVTNAGPWWEQSQGGWYRPNRVADSNANCRLRNGEWESGNASLGWDTKGGACAARIILNNWQFPDDYPWEFVNRRPANFRRP